jgi:hypothetical protein
MKARRLFLVVLLLGTTACVGFAQAIGSFTGARDTHQILSGNLHIDLQSIVNNTGSADTVTEASPKKSGLRAAAMSFVLPGAGEYYVGDIWKAGSFFTAEVGLWVVYAVYTAKGNDRTVFFEEYADKFWSVVQYADWIERNGSTLNPDADQQKLRGLYDRSKINVPPWERVYWDRLNAAEAEIGKRTGTYFSHQLPRRPEQQYYELIGKYGQYNPGWEDGQNLDVSNFHSALTKMFLDYSRMRGEANDFYNIAGTAAKLLVLNHVLSALDAAWSAAMHNKSLKVEAHVLPVQRLFGIVEFVPTAQVSLRF